MGMLEEHGKTFKAFDTQHQMVYLANNKCFRCSASTEVECTQLHVHLGKWPNVSSAISSEYQMQYYTFVQLISI